MEGKKSWSSPSFDFLDRDSVVLIGLLILKQGCSWHPSKGTKLSFCSRWVEDYQKGFFWKIYSAFLFCFFFSEQKLYIYFFTIFVHILTDTPRWKHTLGDFNHVYSNAFFFLLFVIKIRFIRLYFSASTFTFYRSIILWIFAKVYSQAINAKIRFRFHYPKNSF